MLFLIAEMFQEKLIDENTKAKLKYMVFLEEANLFNVFKKGY